MTEVTGILHTKSRGTPARTASEYKRKVFAASGKGNSKEPFVSSFLISRFFDEACDFLSRRALPDVVVDLTYADTGGVRKYRVASRSDVGKRAFDVRSLVGRDELREIAGLCAVCAPVSPDVFVRSGNGEVRIRDDGRAYIKDLLPFARVIRIVDKAEVVSAMYPNCPVVVEDLGDRYVVYSRSSFGAEAYLCASVDADAELPSPSPMIPETVFKGSPGSSLEKSLLESALVVSAEDAFFPSASAACSCTRSHGEGKISEQVVEG